MSQMSLEEKEREVLRFPKDRSRQIVSLPSSENADCAFPPKVHMMAKS